MALRRRCDDVEGRRHEVSHHVDASVGHRESSAPPAARGTSCRTLAEICSGQAASRRRPCTLAMVVTTSVRPIGLTSGPTGCRPYRTACRWHSAKSQKFRYSAGEVGDPGSRLPPSAPRERAAAHAGVIGLSSSTSCGMPWSNDCPPDDEVDRWPAPASPLPPDRPSPGTCARSPCRFWMISNSSAQDDDVADHPRPERDPESARSCGTRRKLAADQQRDHRAQAIIAVCAPYQKQQATMARTIAGEIRTPDAERRRARGPGRARRSSRRRSRSGSSAEDHRRRQADGEQEVRKAAASAGTGSPRVVAPTGCVYVGGPDVEDAEAPAAPVLAGARSSIVEGQATRCGCPSDVVSMRVVANLAASLARRGYRVSLIRHGIQADMQSVYKIRSCCSSGFTRNELR